MFRTISATLLVFVAVCGQHFVFASFTCANERSTGPSGERQYIPYDDESCPGNKINAYFNGQMRTRSCCQCSKDSNNNVRVYCSCSYTFEQYSYSKAPKSKGHGVIRRDYFARMEACRTGRTQDHYSWACSMSNTPLVTHKS